ncbi:phosphatidylserine decarboxylase [Halobacillus locisalis]|uniref:phosphatidylserine decarboxylase n=1 Tax=Halobacillus locisalis TaxID=220753 RepID=A0A838CVB2_9BACI|nr:phosphatidylserine decarboxylase [Halobacillus locisalis]
MKKQVYRGIISVLNSRRIGGVLHNMSRSSVSRWVIPLYAKLFGIDDDELDKQRREFRSLEDFFVRKLKKEARPIEGDVNELVSPVDAKVEQFGRVEDTSIEVKGITYFIEDLLKHEEMSARYRDGLFVVLYLSPGDYHRIHSPGKAVVEKQYDLGGKSTPVNKTGMTLGNSPLSTNYRIVSEMKMDDGMRFALVKVGAMWVNTIELTHPSSEVEKGEEIGYFSFGSTVVLLFEKGKVDLHPNVKRGSLVRVGEPLAVKRL